MPTEKQGNENSKCSHVRSCNLIQDNISRMPNLIQRIQDYYCDWESLRCARRWIYDTLGKTSVPPLLLPNQWEWARQIAMEIEAEDGKSQKASEEPLSTDKSENEVSQEG